MTTTLDGKTGKVIDGDVDGEPAKIDTTQLALIEISLEDIAHDYNRLSKIRDKIASRAGYWRQKCKEYDERIAPILAEIRRRDDEKNDPQQSFEGIHAALAALETEEPSFEEGVE